MREEVRAEKEQRFWGRYIKALHKQGIKSPSNRWYVLRAEQYIKAFPDRRLAEHTAEDVARYLEAVGRQGGLKDW